MGFLNSQDVWFWGQGFAPIVGGYIDLDLSALQWYSSFIKIYNKLKIFTFHAKFTMWTQVGKYKIKVR
jgi:hypothetical protein